MPRLTASAVRRRLGLGEDHRAFLEELAAAGPPASPAALPGAAELPPLLRRLGVADRDAAALTGALPSPDRTPELWWLLERCHRRVVADLGGTSPLPRWPPLPRGLGAPGRLFYAYVFLAAVPDVRGWHRRRGVPDDVSWATLADFGRHLAVVRRLHGEPGADPPTWLRNHFRGALYQLGRLQFCRSRAWSGQAALDLHIPEGGPLAPDACDRALRLARRFFPRHFPDERYRLVVCTSWLLDDQLGAYLRPDSNIMRFQRRFRLLPGGVDGDEDILRFVFRRVAPALDQLPRRTSLERGVVDHLRAGRHWRVRTGWLEL